MLCKSVSLFFFPVNHFAVVHDILAREALFPTRRRGDGVGGTTGGETPRTVWAFNLQLHVPVYCCSNAAAHIRLVAAAPFNLWRTTTKDACCQEKPTMQKKNQHSTTVAPSKMGSIQQHNSSTTSQLQARARKFASVQRTAQLFWLCQTQVDGAFFRRCIFDRLFDMQSVCTRIVQQNFRPPVESLLCGGEKKQRGADGGHIVTAALLLV